MNQMILMLVTDDMILSSIFIILLGLFFIIFQFIVWFKYDWIRRFDIWWNDNVWPVHQQPYNGPSEFSEGLAKFFGIFILGFGAILVYIGFGVIFFGL